MRCAASQITCTSTAARASDTSSSERPFRLPSTLTDSCSGTGPTPSTRVRAPWLISIIWRECSRPIAARTVSRETPSVLASSRSEGSSSPGRSRPEWIM